MTDHRDGQSSEEAPECVGLAKPGWHWAIGAMSILLVALLLALRPTPSPTAPPPLRGAELPPPAAPVGPKGPADPPLSTIEPAATPSPTAESEASARTPEHDRLARFRSYASRVEASLRARRLEEALVISQEAENELQGTPYEDQLTAQMERVEQLLLEERAETLRPPEKAPPEKAPPEKAADEKAPPEKAPPEKAPPEKAPPEKAADVLDAEDMARFRSAIAKGVRSLRASLGKHSLRVGGTPGRYALAAFALLRSGVSPDDPLVIQLFETFQDQTFTHTYSLALAIMALEARSVVRRELAPLPGIRSMARYRKETVPQSDVDRIRVFAAQLAAGHNAGLWHYVCPAPGRTTKQRQKKQSRRGDNSNTQFAVLGLHAASRSGVAIPPELWKNVLEHFLANQRPGGLEAPLQVEWSSATPAGLRPGAGTLVPGEGMHARGWGYSAALRGMPYASMTAAGISSVVIARDELLRAGGVEDDLDARAVKAVREGLAWLGRDLSFDTARVQNWLYYWLYSLEKAMEVSGAEALGGHDWWVEGARALVKKQDPNGSWGQLHQTAFALLFLNRATLHVGVRTVVRGKRRADTVTIGKQQVQLGELVRSLVHLPKKSRIKRLISIRKGLKLLGEELRPILVPSLLHVAGSDDSRIRSFARKTLREVTGRTFANEHQVRTWYDLWGRLGTAHERADFASIPAARQALSDVETGLLLRTTACLCLSRLKAIEAVPELLGEMLRARDPDYRQLVAQTIQILTRADLPLEPEASPSVREAQVARWRAWWIDNGEGLLEGVAFERAIQRVAEAAPGAEEDWQTLCQAGRRAVPKLVAAFSRRPGNAWLCRLLEEITGARPGETPSAWRDWCKANGD